MTLLSSLYGGELISNDIYDTTWSGITNISPSKKAIYDEMETKLTNISEDSTPDLGGQLGVGEYDIKLDALLSADGKYSGTTRDGVLGATIAFGKLVYLNTADQRWELADADAETTSGDVDLAITLASGVDGDTRLLLTDGYVREDDWNFTSYGQALYISTVSGTMTQDVSGYTTGDIVRVVGKAGTTADQIHFDPDGTWIEKA